MLRRRLPFSVALLGILSATAWASEGDRSAAAEPSAPGLERQADNGPPPASAPGDVAPAPASAAPALATDFAERLAADAKLSAADREDRVALAKFYVARQSAPVWVTAAGLSPQGAAVMAEIRKADDWGLEASAFRLPAITAGAELAGGQRADAEIAVSLAILKYARHARGGRAEPTTLSRNLDRKLPLRDPGQVIDEIAKAASPDQYLRGLHPQHPQFEALRQKYLALRRGQPVAQPAAPPEADSKGGKTKAAATPPEAPSARKLLVNMEEWRWMPEDLGDFYVTVSIPEFTLRVVKSGKVIHAERVIVGKVDKQTPVFSDEMEQVIFHPFWGVPDSIKRNEILPSLARGKTTVLTRHNLRIQRGGRDIDPEAVDWATVDMRQFHVYQPPGGGNVLGVVKFRFPNKHEVYMHDTPDKKLFEASVRTFSHGCMRVRDPLKLAELLLAEDKDWPASRVAAAVSNGRQDNQINLTRKFPVHITYFTAAVAEDGKLKTYADIYGHETRIAMGMEGKAHLIPKTKEDTGPIRAEAIGQLAETKSGAARREWINKAFSNN